MLEVYHCECASTWLGWGETLTELAQNINQKYSTKYFHHLPDITIESDNLSADRFKTEFADNEFVVYDPEKDILKAISWSEGPGNWETDAKGMISLHNLFNQRNNKNDIFLITHQSSWFYDTTWNVLDRRRIFKQNYNFSIKSTPFYTFTCPISYDVFWEKRQNMDPAKLIDQMFWLSTTEREDPIKLAELGICNKDTGS